MPPLGLRPASTHDTMTLPQKSLCPKKGNFRAVQTMLWAAVLLLTLPTAALGGRKRHSNPPAPPDPDYVFALAAANRFLHAWQSDDLETGMVLLSDRVRHSQSPEKFEQFFAGSPDRAFEIARGLGNRGRYRFAVVLVMTTGTRLRRRSSEIIVVNTGKNDWVIDKLP
jgi:hypothetical protein